MAVVLPAPAGASASCRPPSRDQQLADQVPLCAVQRDAAGGGGGDRRGHVAFVGPPGAGAVRRGQQPVLRADDVRGGVGLGGMLPVDRLAVGPQQRRRSDAGGEQRVRVVDGDAVVADGGADQPVDGAGQVVRRPGRRRGSAVALRRAGARSARWPARRRRPPRSAGRCPPASAGILARRRKAASQVGSPRRSHDGSHGGAGRSGSPVRPSRRPQRVSPALPRRRRARPAAAPARCAARAWPAGSRAWPAGPGRSPPPGSVGGRSAAGSPRPARVGETRWHSTATTNGERVPGRCPPAHGSPACRSQRRGLRTARPAVAAARTRGGCCRSPTG